MTEPDDIAPLLPWYANRTLGAEDARRVEEHLPGCEDCRAALRHLADYEALWRERGAGAVMDHVQSRLLVEYEEGSRALDPETVAWIRAHLASCTVCADASRVLRELAAHERASGSGAAGNVWAFLTRTLLAPAPALAYLLALLLAYPAYRLLAPAPQQPERSIPARIAPAIHVYPELAFRGGPDASGEPSRQPIEIVVEAPDSPILLVVHSDLDPEQLEDPARRLRLDIRDGETTVWSEERSVSELSEGAVFPVLLFPDRLGAGSTYRIELRSEEELLLERSFVLVGAGESDRP